MSLKTKNFTPDTHPFVTTPNRTVILLSIPVLFSLIAEPITGMVDTAFVKELGAISLAALGIGTAMLSTFFWVFNFLGISAQTEVAQVWGRNDKERASSILSLAMILAVAFGVLILLVITPLTGWFSQLLGAEGEVLGEAVRYTQVRLWGAPAVLIALVGFGVQRGIQDMRTPLWIAILINALNIILDYPMIFGYSFIPAMGVAGAAAASVTSQWIGALILLWVLHRQIGFVLHINFDDVRVLIRVGGDLFIRTGLLTLFLMIGTRVANQISAEAGAAHQAIRTVWLFSAFFMEAFAVTAQSLVGYFLGAGRVVLARSAALVTTQWSFATGILITVGMILGTQLTANLFVPPEAQAIFIGAWIAAAISQPLSALAFITDGIHWGTGDYTWLRNAMFVATTTGIILLSLIDVRSTGAFTLVWIVTIVWLGVRALLGMIRVWPGVGESPLRPKIKPEVSTSAV